MLYVGLKQLVKHDLVLASQSEDSLLFLSYCDTQLISLDALTVLAYFAPVKGFLILFPLLQLHRS